MSGNPFGLAELSHFGQMQRVGGKAAGFINKKFFHPSSLANQEKLWKAQTAAATEARKQGQMEKQREEEMQVEALKKQMYLQGQGKNTSDFMKTASIAVAEEPLTGTQKHEQFLSHQEFKRRKSILKQEQATLKKLEADTQGGGGGDAEGDEGDAPDPAAASSAASSEGPGRILAKSVYKEDIYPNGHESVWGSWFSMDEKRWGFSCCKEMQRKLRCPLAPALPEEPEKQQNGGAEGDEPKAKRRRGRGGKKGGAAGEAADAGNPSAEGGNKGGAAGEATDAVARSAEA
mmetsp:Transcript_82984/g.238497  ORF Transcript_82984/g.238497 Transcript_82984/m.238497 type:complete len:289 (+) Transcript_82984:78-944(+)